jgi:hypothetical protein
MKKHYAFLATLFLRSAIAQQDCPPTISVNQSIAAPLPTWEALANSRLPMPSLIDIEVYAGHPSKSGALVPDQTSRTNQAEISLWNLPPDETPYWMACVYADTRVLLIRPLPKQTRQCKLTTALLRQKRNGIVGFTCS